MELRNRLESIFGKNIVTGECSLDELPPVPIVAPLDIEQASEIVKFAASEKMSLIPSGNGSGLHIGNPPRRLDLIVSTMRLNRSVLHEAADLVATVDAGVPFLELQKALAQNRQWLPVDPPRPSSTTVGAVVATAFSGALKYSRGGVRNYLIGLKVVQPDGKLTKFGGKVVKNVAGYDLMKLYTGSFGTLGLIVELSFKLHPLPQSDVTLAIVCRNVTELLQTLSPLPLAAIAVLSPQLSAQLGISTSEYSIAVRLLGTENSTKQLRLRLLQTLSQASCQEYPELWQKLEEFHCSSTNCLLASSPSSKIPLLLELCKNWPVECRVGSSQRIYPDPLDLEMISELRKHFPVMVERADPSLKRNLDSRGLTSDQITLMAAIKKTLDPDDIFSPGRMF
ncbi:MAG: FAD-binding oxidoreductase [Acidobacteriota bacterium]|nr:FAD-binding oxidoreductase [Blastocatellia bacterium]MDW8411568.1 FAD-binding oxidoreductase [Acidobacteriota bacterium]